MSHRAEGLSRGLHHSQRAQKTRLTARKDAQYVTIANKHRDSPDILIE